MLTDDERRMLEILDHIFNSEIRPFCNPPTSSDSHRPLCDIGLIVLSSKYPMARYWIFTPAGIAELNRLRTKESEAGDE